MTPVASAQDYQIVKYSPECKSQILELQKHHWGANEALNAAYLSWKYDQNPYLHRSSNHISPRGEHLSGLSTRGSCARSEGKENAELWPNPAVYLGFTNVRFDKFAAQPTEYSNVCNGQEAAR